LASPDLTAMQKAVLLAIIEHPRISRKGLAQQFEVHESAIQKHIEALKTKKSHN
jgi:predicted ArsR family transcriptional regulator